MSYLRVAVTAVILVFCACAVQESHAKNIEWKSLPAVKEFLRSNPRARLLMRAGPVDDLIDLLIQILIRIIEEILNNQPLRSEVTGSGPSSQRILTSLLG